MSKALRAKSERIPGNVFNKYETRNPVGKLLIRHFISVIKEIVISVPASSILDVGCGEGNLTRLFRRLSDNETRIFGSDLSKNIYSPEAVSDDSIYFIPADIYDLPFSDGSFDFVVASEVLEHLTWPDRGLQEILRVTSKYFLLSVPHEPIWRICNVLRGKYVMRLGNTPGHIQHWNLSKFLKWIDSYAHIELIRLPFPWLIVFGAKNT